MHTWVLLYDRDVGKSRGVGYGMSRSFSIRIGTSSHGGQVRSNKGVGFALDDCKWIQSSGYVVGISSNEAIRLFRPFALPLSRARVSGLSLPHSITQQPPPSPFSNVNRAALVAASKTSSTPSPLRLEHSRYFLAPTSRAAASPSCSVQNRSDFLRISSMATGSSRKSFLSPTSMMGTPGHFSVASSTHYIRESTPDSFWSAWSVHCGVHRDEGAMIEMDGTTPDLHMGRGTSDGRTVP